MGVKMKKVFLCLIFAAVAIYGATIFGPVSYYRTTGSPDTYDTSFAAFFSRRIAPAVRRYCARSFASIRENEAELQIQGRYTAPAV